MSGAMSDLFITKLTARVTNEGYVVDPNGALAMTVAAGQSCYTGLQKLEDCLQKKHGSGPNAAIEGRPGSQAVADLCGASVLPSFVILASAS